MKHFPKTVQHSMRSSGTAATCIPVQFDGGDWESAFFLHVAGPESRQDRRVLKNDKITPTSLSSELLTHASAAVVVMRIEVSTVHEDPLVFEILLLPGKLSVHYECLKLLARQSSIHYFFSDSDYRVLQEQRQEISESQHGMFETLAREAFAHDSVLRMAGKYDSDTAVADIVAHYQVRSAPSRDPNSVSH